MQQQCLFFFSSYIPTCSAIDSRDPLERSESVSDFQFFAVSDLKQKLMNSNKCKADTIITNNRAVNSQKTTSFFLSTGVFPTFATFIKPMSDPHDSQQMILPLLMRKTGHQHELFCLQPSTYKFIYNHSHSNRLSSHMQERKRCVSLTCSKLIVQTSFCRMSHTFPQPH